MIVVKERPKISVIVPVYNDAAYISKCLDSILSQTLRSIEVIVVNDGATDNSGEICDNYARKNNKVKVIHQAKQGVSVARNTGLSYAQGEFIGFVDADDYIQKNMYETLYVASRNTGSDISVCKLGREIDGKLVTNDDKFYSLELNNKEAMKEMFKGILYRFSLCNKLFKRKVFEGINFPVGRIHEDLSTTYKLFAKAEKVIYLNFIGYVYVRQEKSILTTPYYEKRLDAFIGWDEILSFIKQKYVGLFDTVNSCFIYSCLDHIYLILNQVEDKRYVYLIEIQSITRLYYRDILKNPFLSFRTKSIITTLNYNINLFILIYLWKSKFKKMKRTG